MPWSCSEHSVESGVLNSLTQNTNEQRSELTLLTCYLFVYCGHGDCIYYCVLVESRGQVWEVALLLSRHEPWESNSQTWHSPSHPTDPGMDLKMSLIQKTCNNLRRQCINIMETNCFLSPSLKAGCAVAFSLWAATPTGVVY